MCFQWDADSWLLHTTVLDLLAGGIGILAFIVSAALGERMSLWSLAMSILFAVLGCIGAVKYKRNKS